MFTLEKEGPSSSLGSGSQRQALEGTRPCSPWPCPLTSFLENTAGREPAHVWCQRTGGGAAVLQGRSWASATWVLWSFGVTAAHGRGASRRTFRASPLGHPRPFSCFTGRRSGCQSRPRLTQGAGGGRKRMGDAIFKKTSVLLGPEVYVYSGRLWAGRTQPRPGKLRVRQSVWLVLPQGGGVRKAAPGERWGAEKTDAGRKRPGHQHPRALRAGPGAARPR